METYSFGQMLLASIGCMLFGAGLVYFCMREKQEGVDQTGETTYEPEYHCEEREDGFVTSGTDPDPIPDTQLFDEELEAYERQLAADEEDRALQHERERVKPTLDVYIKSLLVAGYVMVDDIPRRFAFCITDGEQNPYAVMYYYGEEHDDMLQIYIDDHRRLKSPPAWYDLIFNCERLTAAMKMLVNSINSMGGIKLTTYERPIKMVIHGDAYLPVLKVYDDMSWFEDLRWKGPVIVAGRDGEARGIVPDEMPFELYEYSEKLVKDSHQYFEQIPLSDERCVNLQEAIRVMRTTIEEAGCHA